MHYSTQNKAKYLVECTEALNEKYQVKKRLIQINGTFHTLSSKTQLGK